MRETVASKRTHPDRPTLRPGKKTKNAPLSRFFSKLLEHIKRAADVSPIALALFLAIHHRTSVTGQEWITTPTELLKKFGLTKQSKSDHLKPIADAGLIEIEWRGKGRTPLVRLAPRLAPTPP